MKKIIYICLLLFSIPLFLNAYESMHEKTPVNKIQILELPARLALEAKTDDSYFIKDNGLFRSLFRYITKNDISMTTPVEADINPGKMRFFVGDKDKTKNLESNDLIKVYKVPTKMVVSVGIRGRVRTSPSNPATTVMSRRMTLLGSLSRGRPLQSLHRCTSSSSSSRAVLRTRPQGRARRRSMSSGSSCWRTT